MNLSIQPVILTFNNYDITFKVIDCLKEFDEDYFLTPLCFDNSEDSYIQKQTDKIKNYIFENSKYIKGSSSNTACNSILDSPKNSNASYFWFLGDDFPRSKHQYILINMLKKNMPDQIFFNYINFDNKKKVRPYNDFIQIVNLLPAVLRRFFIHRFFGLNLAFMPAFFVERNVICSVHNLPLTRLLPLKISLTSRNIFYCKYSIFEAGNFTKRMSKELFLEVFFDDFLKEVNVFDFVYWSWLLRCCFASLYNYGIYPKDIKKIYLKNKKVLKKTSIKNNKLYYFSRFIFFEISLYSLSINYFFRKIFLSNLFFNYKK